MSNSSPEFEVCADREAASSLAAERLAHCLSKDLEAGMTGSLILSGGSTPKQCLGMLAQYNLAWSRVQVCLTDERCVDVNSELRNARMLRENFFNVGAGDAELFALTEDAIARLRTPFSAVLVGMGDDGHFASIFPDMANRNEALDLQNPVKLVNVVTSASPVLRVSMSLSLLVQSKQIVLLAFGAEKRAILDEPDQFPVADLLRQTQAPVSVVWAP